MRRIYHILYMTVLAMAVLTAGGCTRMDGDIGDLFGRWNLTALTADGEEQTLYDGGTGDDDVQLYTFSFQSDLAWILTLYPHQMSHTAKGLWSRTDTQLMLDYSYSDDEGTDYYTPPSALHLVQGGVTTLNIESLTSSHMTLWYVADDDVRYEYHFTKAY